MSSKQGTSSNSQGDSYYSGGGTGGEYDTPTPTTKKKALKEKQIKEAQKEIQSKIDRERYGAGKAYGAGKISKERIKKTEMYGGKASKMTNEYLVSIGEAKRGNPYYDHKGKITGYSYILTSKGREMKYGQSGGAMGSGDPTGIMSSTAISRTMWDAQKDIQQLMKLGPMGLMMSASKANESSYNKYIDSFYNQRSSTSIAYNTNAGNISNGENQNAVTGEEVLDKSFSDTLADASEKNKSIRMAAVTGATGGEDEKRKFLQASKRVFGGGMTVT
jgi:hypothetical protein